MLIENLSRRGDYLATAPQWARTLWPRIQSLNWFIKSRRHALLEAGAVVMLGREYFIIPDVFTATAAEMYGLKVKQAEVEEVTA